MGFTFDLEESLDLPETFSENQVKAYYETQNLSTAEMLEVYADVTVEHWGSGFVDEQTIVGDGASGSIGLDEDVSVSVEEQLACFSDIVDTTTLYDVDECEDSDNVDGAVQTEDGVVSSSDNDTTYAASEYHTDDHTTANNTLETYSLNAIFRSLFKYTLLPGIDHLTSIVARSVHDMELENDLRELQEATAAFLADQYDDGEYIATQDDISELQEATATFLADRYDGESFCLDETVSGLLLPGEQFLLPVATAVNTARADSDVLQSIIDIINEYLPEQTWIEDLPHTLPPDAVQDAPNEPKIEHGTLEELLGLSMLPNTPDYEVYNDPSLLQEYPYLSLDGLLDSSHDFVWESDDYSDDESDGTSSETVTSCSNATYDAPDALSLSQASYAASFFDTGSATLIGYVSLDQLLATYGDDDETLLRVYRTVNAVDDHDSDDDCSVAELGEQGGSDYEDININLDDLYFGWDEPFQPVAQHNIKHEALKVVTQLPTIFEGDEACSSTPGSSIDFANHRDYLVVPSSRRENFLQEEDEGFAPLSSNPVTVADVMDIMTVSVQNPGLLHGEDNRIPVTSTVSEAKAVSIDDMSDDKLLQTGHLVQYGEAVRKDLTSIEDVFANDIWEHELDLKLTLPHHRHLEAGVSTEAELEASRVLQAVFSVVQAHCADLPAFSASLRETLRELLGDSRSLV